MSGATDPADGRPFLVSIGSRAPAARLGVTVVRELASSIVMGEVAPGDSLPPEGILSEQFGVSRTVIRESVKRIEEKGLVTVAQGRGTQVQPRSSWNVLDPVVLSAMVEHDDSLGILDDLSTVRSALEGAMSAETATRRSEADVTRIEAALALMDATIHDDDAFAQADADFHFLVMELSGNVLAESITKILFRRARESYRFTSGNSPEAFRITLDEHRRITEAIAAGDAAAAEAAMRAHIDDAWQRRRLPTHRKR